MKQELLLGDEAVALGAVHAGISGCYAYPGTPSTEIMEFIQRLDHREQKLHTAWSANEKVAYEEALGMSYAGKRAIIAMKHVGLNVAADPFMNSAVTGVNGGLMLAVADDPGMHSSQNEQDSRYYSDMSRIPCFEPATQQEAYDMTRDALDLSEKLNLPMMMRLVTRLAHSRANITTRDPREPNPLNPSDNREQWVLLPSNARRQWHKLLERWSEIEAVSENGKYNRLQKAPGARTGIIASGIAYNYLMEYLGDRAAEYSIFKISFYPLPLESLRNFLKEHDEIYVVEEGYPFIERRIRELDTAGLQVKGKLSGELPPDGELNPALVRRLFEPDYEIPGVQASELRNRPPQLCPGCPHTDSFNALNMIMEAHPQGRVFSDIGCYTLAALPPHNAIDTTVDMGASVSMANGAYHAGISPAFAVIGDSTFAHSGITPLLDAVKGNFNIKLIILDNEAVAMTGAQETLLTRSNLEQLVLGTGIDPDHLAVLEAKRKNHADNVARLKKELEYHGPSVIIFRRPCIYV